MASGLQSNRPWHLGQFAVAAILVTWAGYAIITLRAPYGPNTFGLSSPQLTLLRLTILIPVLIIWIMAIRGIVAFKNYASMLPQGAESSSLHRIANGLLWIIGYLAAQALFSAAMPYLLGTSIYNPFIVIRDHIPPIASLIGFGLTFSGSLGLRKIAHFKTWTIGTLAFTAGYALFAVLLILEFLTSQQTPIPGTTPTSSALVPHSTLLFTLVLPYLAAWYIGLLSAINIGKYAAKVKGVLYRQALQDLMRGLWGVIIFVSLAQVLTFAVNILAKMRLAPILILLYSLLILYAVGFVFVRRGAKKLARIELAK